MFLLEGRGGAAENTEGVSKDGSAGGRSGSAQRYGNGQRRNGQSNLGSRSRVCTRVGCVFARIRIRPMDNRAVSIVGVSNSTGFFNRMDDCQGPLEVEGNKEREQK